jgi:hypothetical protein
VYPKVSEQSIKKCTLTFGITRCCPLQRVIAAKLTRLTHKIVIQVHLVAENCIICISCSRQPVRKRLDTRSYQRLVDILNRSHNATIKKFLEPTCEVRLMVSLAVPRIRTVTSFFEHTCWLIFGSWRSRLITKTNFCPQRNSSPFNFYCCLIKRREGYSLLCGSDLNKNYGWSKQEFSVKSSPVSGAC